MMKLCHYCKGLHEEFDVRPYGHNGALICFKCMISDPELEKVAKANFLSQLEAAEAANKHNIAVIGEPSGPRPLNPGSLV